MKITIKISNYGMGLITKYILLVLSIPIFCQDLKYQIETTKNDSLLVEICNKSEKRFFVANSFNENYISENDTILYSSFFSEIRGKYNDAKDLKIYARNTFVMLNSDDCFVSKTRRFNKLFVEFVIDNGQDIKVQDVFYALVILTPTPSHIQNKTNIERKNNKDAR